MKRSALQLTGTDPVATALEDIAEGDLVTVSNSDGRETAEIPARTAIPRGHKIALKNLCKNTYITKYGYTIGIATKDILCGDHVHTDNLASLRGRGDL